MGNVAERDPMETRSLILKEFGKVQTRIVTNPELWRKLSFDAHKELCKVLGDDFIDYPEFEFWFSRFARGKLYLDYDRSSDSKPRSFTDLPQDVFKNVGEYLELHDRLLLRDVCKDIRYQVDNWDLKVDEISFIDGSHWEVKVTNGSGSYRAKDFGKNEDNICYPAFYRNPISFVMNILMLPNLLLKKLTFAEQDEYWEKLINKLDESNRKIHVKKIQFPYFHSSRIDLHFMAPGVLEEIKMSPVYPKREKFSEIIESEQCQSAKTVYIESLLVTSRFPLDVLYHCPRFTVLLDDSAEKLKAEFLKKLMKYGEVQKCVVYISICRSRLSQILSYFNEPEAMVPNFPSLRRYPIPGSNEFYELEQVFLRNRTSVDRYGLQEEFVRLERKHKTHEMVVAIRGRILEEFGKVETQIAANPELWRELSFEAHKELCKVLGANFIDYPEFEFWFSRFLQGNFDLDYDRRSDPKTRSLIDLPQDVFKNVGENLELHDRFQLRNVCKDFRIQIDNWDLKVTKIYYNHAKDWRVTQTSRPEPYCAADFGTNENNISSSGFYRNPISFVMNILKHPKLRLEKLTIDLQSISCKKLIKRLDASNRKLHVKKVHFPYYCSSSNNDLHFMIPGVLEEIILSNLTGREFYYIIKSEQYQAAKMVHIESRTATSYFPLTSLYDCPRFTLKLGGRPADALKAMFLKKLMNKGNVQECAIYAEREIMKYFNEPEAMVPNFPTLRRYPIRKTNDFYEIEYQGEAVRLERKP